MGVAPAGATGAAGTEATSFPAGHGENAAMLATFLLYLSRLLVAVVVAANVRILPARTGRDPRPAGASVVVNWTTKPEREEIAVVESVMIVVIMHAPCKVSGTIPTMNTSGSHRTTTDLAHISPMHHHGSSTTS
jgi:hypothetical protein